MEDFAQFQIDSIIERRGPGLESATEAETAFIETMRGSDSFDAFTQRASWKYDYRDGLSSLWYFADGSCFDNGDNCGDDGFWSTWKDLLEHEESKEAIDAHRMTPQLMQGLCTQVDSFEMIEDHCHLRSGYLGQYIAGKETMPIDIALQITRAINFILNRPDLVEAN